MKKEFLVKILKEVYGKNFNTRVAIEDMLDRIGKKEQAAYDKLTKSLTNEQYKLLDDYLRLYCLRIFKMQYKRFDCGFRIGLEIGKTNKENCDNNHDTQEHNKLNADA